jgi:hypothetical protein
MYALAAAQDVNERSRILAAMPECTSTMTTFSAAATPSIPERAELRDRARFTLTTGPLMPVAGLIVGGVALDVRFETLIQPHVSIAVTGEGIYAHALLTDDVYVTALLGIADVRLYTERFSGGYVGAGPAYIYVSNTGGTGFLGGKVEADEGSAVGGTAFLGWKWVRASGFTQSLQLGIVGAHGIDGTKVAPNLSWHIGGTFGG